MPAIRIYDTETQGFEATDQVCELGWTDLVKEADGWSIGFTGSRLCRVETMPPPARAVHHIHADDTAGFPAFDPEVMWAEAKADGIDVVAAHNWAFDALRFGEAQLPAICTLKVARRLWPDAPGHSNQVLRYWLEDEGEIACDPKRAEPSHRAGPDTYVTANVLRHMLSLTTAAQMVAWTKDPMFYARCPIGDPWRGKPWAEVDFGFVKWIVDRRKDDPDLVWNAQRELERRRLAA